MVSSEKHSGNDRMLDLCGVWVLDDQYWVGDERYESHYRLRISIRDGEFEIDFRNTVDDHSWIGDIEWKNNRLRFSVEYYDGEDYEDWSLGPVSSTELTGELHGEEMILHRLRRTTEELLLPVADKSAYFPICGDAPEKLSGTWQREGDITQLKIRLRESDQRLEILEHDHEEIAEIRSCEWKDDSLHLHAFWHSTKWNSMKRMYFNSDVEMFEELKFEHTYRFLRLPSDQDD